MIILVCKLIKKHVHTEDNLKGLALESAGPLPIEPDLTHRERRRVMCVEYFIPYSGIIV